MTEPLSHPLRRASARTSARAPAPASPPMHRAPAPLPLPRRRLLACAGALPALAAPFFPPLLRPRAARAQTNAAEATEAASETDGTGADKRADHPEVARALAWVARQRNMVGEFIQIADDGSQDRGRIRLLRPGRMRIDYDTLPLVLLADGINWILYDREEDSRSEALLSSTPLHLLLAKTPSTEGVRVLRVAAEAGAVELEIEDAKRPEHGRLTIRFTEAPYALAGWLVLDAQGRRTRVSLVNARWNLPEAQAPTVFDFRADRLE